MSIPRDDGDPDTDLPEACPECGHDWGPVDPLHDGEQLRSRRCSSCGEWSRLA